MAVLPILSVDSKVVRQKCKRVKRIDASIHKLLDDMVETMRAVEGAGLAAPQVGVPLRVAVIELPGESLLELINPEVIKAAGERDVEEGCLCLPGYVGQIRRSLTVKVKAQDRQGKPVRLKAEGLLAEALEHEIDHLNGVLFLDHLESMDKLRKVEPQPVAPEGEAEGVPQGQGSPES